jgi:5-formyltetrahydrofolate cyclo-ligase
MTGRCDDEESGACSSPPCFLHEVDPAYSGLGAAGSNDGNAVSCWRVAERKRLIAQRLAIPADLRRQMDAQIASHLAAAVGDVAGQVVSVYWPVRGEPDLRAFAAFLIASGARTALPAVVAPDRPLVFRAWAPNDPVVEGAWGIPMPHADAAVVAPDVVIAPVVGFDAAAYRLGYGGGFFDRTLAASSNRPRAFGVAYSQAAIPTIYPQPHDIPMSMVVTEEGPIGTP